MGVALSLAKHYLCPSEPHLTGKWGPEELLQSPMKSSVSITWLAGSIY